MKKIALNEENVKYLGRTVFIDDGIWCGLSGTGISFKFRGKRLKIELAGDSGVFEDASNHARVGIYLDNKRIKDIMIDEKSMTVDVIDSEVEVSNEIRIVKLSESAMSTFGITELSADNDAVIGPADPKERKIEFIGDSITCGYALDDEDLSHVFSTATEDVTKTYAYKTASALDADYSFVCMSGYGIISGYTANGEKISSQTIPQYFDGCGFSYHKFADKIYPSDVKWDHSRFSPDVVVINLGTNDDSYCLDDESKQKEFSDAYSEFLKQVRNADKKALIICCVGIMGQRIFPAVKCGAEKYISETGDDRVAIFEFDEQLETDGRVVDYHPTVVTNSKAADVLIAEIKKDMNW